MASPGDLVYIKSDGSKHVARDRSIVTSLQGTFACVKKLRGSQFRSKTYEVKACEIYPVPSAVPPLQNVHLPSLRDSDSSDDCHGVDSDVEPQEPIEAVEFDMRAHSPLPIDLAPEVDEAPDDQPVLVSDDDLLHDVGNGIVDNLSDHQDHSMSDAPTDDDSDQNDQRMPFDPQGGVMHRRPPRYPQRDKKPPLWMTSGHYDFGQDPSDSD